MGDDKVKLRRYEDDLNVGGLGVIVLGGWNILKLVMVVFIEFKNDFSLDEYKGLQGKVLAK